MTAEKTYEQELRERSERQKLLDSIVSAAMDRVRAAIVGRQPAVSSHFSYGSSAIHQRHLVTGTYSARMQSGRRRSKTD